MRVIEAERFGGPEVLRVKTVPDPRPGPGQVVVEVKVAGVLSIDTVIRRGEAGDLFPVSPPYVPGAGAAGQVAELGDGVDRSWCGQWVLADVDGGGYAEQVLATPGQLIRVPPGVGLREAMALLHDGATALAVFERAGVRRGETVLVQPAGGGLGSLLVQLAHAAGARVTGAARGAEKLETVRALGADAVVDYSEPGWATRVGPVDVVFDGVGGGLGRAAAELVVPGGRYSNYGFAGGAPLRADEVKPGVTAYGLDQLHDYAPGRRDRARRMLGLAARGKVRTVIGQTFPLARAADAHRALEARAAKGKTLLVV
ncbi:zinc-binding dehydrogenase [Amycolatopsis thermophila]|uniref:NADPH2:quinone reductase n=1 Tax=Amycolatopsis thermophila TaxID=206084 RepID=A0ABU0F3J0_9PSEU|nr:zinc-binding dehydrogenase [Amycolatopsis thermophila]MDQ0382106.1 NADPH2:quinone reductase [Amycolatopsis thermophila]